MRELAELSQAAAEVLKGYLSGQVGFPEKCLNPKLCSPAYSTRAGKEPRQHTAMKSNRVSVRERQREMQRPS